QVVVSLSNSTNFPYAMQRRVGGRAGKRLTKDGVIGIAANSHRDQPMNREDALERRVGLLVSGAHVPKARVATRPTLASKRRRLEGKSIRSEIKKLRGNPKDGQ